MKIEQIIMARMYTTDERHLCVKCNRLYDACDSEWTTLDPHPCDYSYKKDVESVDNGGGFYITKCPYFVPMDTRLLYSEYMKTEEWKDIASEAKEKAGFKCRLCGSGINLCVHHTSYDNLCMEDRHPEDIVVLCRKCHDKIHEEDIKTAVERKEAEENEKQARNYTPHAALIEFIRENEDCKIQNEIWRSIVEKQRWVNKQKYNECGCNDSDMMEFYYLGLLKKYGGEMKQKWMGEEGAKGRRDLFNKTVKEYLGWTSLDQETGYLVKSADENGLLDKV